MLYLFPVKNSGKGDAIIMTDHDEFDKRESILAALRSVFSGLPKEVMDKLRPLMEIYQILVRIISGMPESIREKIANFFAHQIISAFKEINRDSDRFREVLDEILILMFNLSEDWHRTWPLQAQDSEKE